MSNSTGHHVCPGWMAPFFVIPLRHFSARPKRTLSPYIRPGDTVLDIGCGPGFFTLPMARLVGRMGRVIAADLQPAMLAMTRRRAKRWGLASRVTLHQTPADRIGLETPLDFALAANVIHELPDAAGFFKELFGLLKPGGHVYLIEPAGHVIEAEWAAEQAQAQAAGFTVVTEQKRPRSYHGVLTKAAEVNP